MDLNLTPEETKFRDELRAWLEANVPKDWGEWREKPLEESFPYLRAWQRKLYEGGWLGITWPREYGGRGVKLPNKHPMSESGATLSSSPTNRWRNRCPQSKGNTAFVLDAAPRPRSGRVSAGQAEVFDAAVYARDPSEQLRVQLDLKPQIVDRIGVA